MASEVDMEDTAGEAPCAPALPPCTRPPAPALLPLRRRWRRAPTLRPLCCGFCCCKDDAFECVDWLPYPPPPAPPPQLSASPKPVRSCSSVSWLPALPSSSRPASSSGLVSPSKVVRSLFVPAADERTMCSRHYAVEIQAVSWATWGNRNKIEILRPHQRVKKEIGGVFTTRKKPETRGKC